MTNSFNQELDLKFQKREVVNLKTSNLKNNQREVLLGEILMSKLMRFIQLRCQCIRIGMKKEPLHLHMIKQVAEAAGLSQLLVPVRHLPFCLAMIKSYKNTPSNNCWIAIKVTTLAPEVGCTKVTNTLASTESFEKTTIVNTVALNTNATSTPDGP